MEFQKTLFNKKYKYQKNLITFPKYEYLIN